MKNKQEHVRSHRFRCGGFTLLEILLSFTVLLIGLTAILQTTRSALRNLAAAKELTEIQIACQTELNELLAQSSPIKPDLGKAVLGLPNWKIRIDLYPAPQPELYVLHLSAQQFTPPNNELPEIKYQLLRWIPSVRVFTATQPKLINEFEDPFQY
jgi:type II secretory pathway pseudopilin PulG